MLSTYEDYLSQPGSLTWEEMLSLHKEIMTEAGQDEDAADLYKDLLTAAAKYSESRAHWHLWDKGKKLAEDSTRTSRHNQVIDCFNILARYLRTKGNPAVWREVLGEDRRRIGDFACFLIFVESLNAR